LEANIDTAASTQQDTTPMPKEVPAPPSEERKTTQDEFEDMDDELFDDTDELLSQQPVQKPEVPTPVLPSHRAQPSTAAQRKPEVEDEFDDDFGADIDFEAFELAATQAHQQASKGGASVR